MDKQALIESLMKYRYAHRGLYSKPVIPENSIPAFKKAVSEGYGIEFDIHLTSDGKLAVIHDSNLKRMCGVDKIIEHITLEEAQEYYLDGSEEKIPEFAQVLEAVDGKVPLIIEFKPGFDINRWGVSYRLCRAAMEVLDNYEGMYCVESFNPVAVRWFRKNRPDIVRGQLAGNVNREKKQIPGVLMLLLKDLFVNRIGNPDFVAYDINDRNTRAIKKYKGPIFFWTVRSYEDLISVEKQGATAIFEKFNPKQMSKEP